MRATNAETRFVYFAGIKTGGETDIVVEAAGEPAVHPNPAFAPGGRDDACLDVVAKHAIESRRLVILVQESQRNQHQTGFKIERVVESIVDPSLLHLDLACVDAACDSVFDFQFGLKGQLVIEAMTDK